MPAPPVQSPTGIVARPLPFPFASTGRSRGCNTRRRCTAVPRSTGNCTRRNRRSRSTCLCRTRCWSPKRRKPSIPPDTGIRQPRSCRSKGTPGHTVRNCSCPSEGRRRFGWRSSRSGSTPGTCTPRSHSSGRTRTRHRPSRHIHRSCCHPCSGSHTPSRTAAFPRRRRIALPGKPIPRSSRSLRRMTRSCSGPSACRRTSAPSSSTPRSRSCRRTGMFRPGTQAPCRPVPLGTRTRNCRSCADP
jgi:hypothetical protein